MLVADVYKMNEHFGVCQPVAGFTEVLQDKPASK